MAFRRPGGARALMLDPKLLIADEPVSALDVSIRSQILKLMHDLQDRHNLSYLIISHDLAVARYMSDRIGVACLGKLVETGPAGAVCASPAHPYTAALITAIPSPGPAHREEPPAAAGPRRAAVGGEPAAGCRFRTRCPIAEEICAEVEPPMQPFGPDHYAACHFPLRRPVSVQATAGAAGMSATAGTAADGTAADEAAPARTGDSVAGKP